MTNEEAISILLSIKEHFKYKNGYEPPQNEALDMAISALERDRWIPCEERLPEDGKNVLCRIEKECMYYDDAGGEVFVMDYFIIEGHYRKGKYKGWYRAVSPDVGRYTNSVTHWRPLPEPPKEET